MHTQQRHLPHGLILLYEDKDVLVVNKPTGLLSIASGTEKQKTAYWILAEYLRRKGEKRRPAVVHRLDKDTSGILLFVKSERVKKFFMDNWNDRIPLRRYIAVAEGIINEAEGVIDQPLGEDSSKRVVVRSDGQKAVTRFSTLRTGGSYSLVALELETGRRNQIRAHLDWFRHPIAGDTKYRSRTNPLNRLCLHAETLHFYHPISGQLMQFEAKAPDGFHRLVRL